MFRWLHVTLTLSLLCVLLPHPFSSDLWGQRPNVNERTLNLFLPVTHLSLPCFVSIEIKAAYNSYSGGQSIFGRKWTFNHNVHITEDVTHFTVHEGDGFENRYTREQNLQDAEKSLAAQIIIEMKKVDAREGGLKEQSEYDRIERRLNEDRTFREEQAKRFITSARPLGPGEYFSLRRGQTKLIRKPDRSFERQFPNGSREFFNSDGKMIRSQDRNGNALNFVYQNDRLIRITDICNRSVEFEYYTTPALAGLVRNIKDSLGRSLQFTFDNNRRLIAHTTVDGATISYRYTDLSYITEIKNSADRNATINFKYNDRLEVIEQVGPGEARTTYERTFVAEDPNHSITDIRRFQGNALQSRETLEEKVGEHRVVTTFNAAGQQTSRRTTRFSSVSGFPESILDDQGRGEVYQYDSRTGSILSKEDVVTKNKMEFSYHPTCEQIQSIRITQPEKEPVTMSYEFDSKCNPTRAREQGGDKLTGHIEVQYDNIGRTTFLIDRINDRQIAFTHWPYGRPQSITLRNVGTLLIKYHDNGNIDQVDTFPHGEKGKERFKDQPPARYQQTILQEVRGSLDQMLRLLKPAGLSIGI